MTVTFGVRPVESLSAMDEVMASAPGGPAEETFAFDITFDPAYTASGVVYQVDRWLELDGQRHLRGGTGDLPHPRPAQAEGQRR